ncbi:hypothetical protein [Streptomyces sp. NPDC003006]
MVRLKPGTVDQRITLTGLDGNTTSKKGPAGLRVAEGRGLLCTAWPTTAATGLVCVSTRRRRGAGRGRCADPR